jgi:branched-chain amino acid transport system substrate-binding protein
MSAKQKFLITLVVTVAVIGLVFSSSTWAKVEGDTIILGAAVSLTGKYSINGEHTKNGYELAVKRINELGGVKVGGKSYKFKIIYYDDESNSGRAAQLAERLIKQDGVKFMLGPYSSGLTKAIAPITEENKIPMVEANGASRSLFTKGYKYLFAVLSAANQYLEVAIDLAVEKNGGKPVRIAMAFEQDAFSQDVRLGVVDAAKRTGSEIIIDDKLPKELNDMAAILSKVKATKPDVLVVSGHSKGASLNYKDKFFGTAAKFDKDFNAEYGYAPPYQAAESAAALLVYKDAFERANSFDKEKVRDALEETFMQTFYGNIKFSPQGQNIAKPMVLFQVRCKGDICENKVVAPTKWASAELVHPTPKWSER